MTAPFSDLIDESLDEAVFLWGRWEQELTSLTRNLDEVYSWTEDRLHGALDGVRTAGSGLIDTIGGGLLAQDSRQVVVSSTLLGSTDDAAAVAALSDALRSADDAPLEGMLRGLELVGSSAALRAAARVLVERGPRHSGGLCRLKAFRRVAGGDEIGVAFGSADVDAQMAALRAAGHTPTPSGKACIDHGLHHDDPQIRAAAVEVGLSVGNRDAWEIARTSAARLDERSSPYLTFVALLGSPDDHEIIYGALRNESLRVAAIWALGHLGTSRAVEACIAGMAHESLARAAGEAYCWITGADLDRDRLAAVETPPEVPAFEDDDLDAKLVPSAEALWPTPDPERVKEHWRTRSGDLVAGVRHLYGQPVSRDVLRTMVERGPMLRRPDLILELRARTRGRYDVEPRAFAARQREMMATSRIHLTAV